MKSFTYTCLDISEVCEHNRLDLSNVMDTICNSDVSFGTNYDTLLSVNMLEDILETRLDWNNHDEDNIYITLGS
jgi:hypothetical protein